MGDLDCRDRGLAHALHTRERFVIRRQQPADPAEFREQGLGQRFGVASRDSQREKIFDQLVIEQRVGSALVEPLAQAGAVAAIVWFGNAHCG